jgi:tRNA threonylcarbamoyl adenosine modification protein YeaZ
MTSSAVSPGSRCIEPLLVLNGAEEPLQLVLGRRSSPGGEYAFLHSQEWAAPGEAARYLAPSIEHALRSAGVASKDLAGVACVRGPGGFTGLRLVLATALGLASAWSLPLAGVEYLPLLGVQAANAAHTLCPGAAGSVFAVTHARHEQVYIQGFSVGKRGGEQSPSPLSKAAAMTVDRAARIVLAGAAPRFVCGSGLRRNRAFFEAVWAGEAIMLGAGFERPRPETLLVAAAGASYAQASVEPLYLRPSDAEANLQDIASKAGLDAGRMAERLAALTS